jgi:undecaprenyl diphosphate synthase
MALLREFLKKELNELVGNEIRLSVIGRLDDLEPEVRGDVENALETTSANSGMELCIALSYGGRTEIVDACRSIVRSGIAADDVDAALFAGHLYTAGRPDPDLLIRTSGELRLSNFLLWQIAYAEIWVTDTLWPDFRRRELFEALLEYQRRERRYGGLARGGGRKRARAARG